MFPPYLIYIVFINLILNFFLYFIISLSIVGIVVGFQFKLVIYSIGSHNSFVYSLDDGILFKIEHLATIVFNM